MNKILEFNYEGASKSFRKRYHSEGELEKDRARLKKICKSLGERFITHERIFYSKIKDVRE